jgi:bacterioferritin (cytochrome b1)
MNVWYVITMLTPCILVTVAWTYGNKIAQANKATYLQRKMQDQLMGLSRYNNTSEMVAELQLHRFREEYAHGEITLPELEATIEAILEREGKPYGRQGS